MLAVVLMILGLAECSKKPVESAQKTELEFGVVLGTVQLGLKSGDVKSIAFTPARLGQQEFEVLTDSQKADLAADTDLYSDAIRLGLMSVDEAEVKTKAKLLASEIFHERLPQKKAIPAAATATTDGNGAFKFDSVSPGTYWMFLDTEVGINTIGWAVKVEVKARQTTKVNLNNTNLDYGFH